MIRRPFHTRRRERGQATAEYALLLALTGLLGMYLMQYTLGVFSDGMEFLSRNLGAWLDVGAGFGP